MKRPLLELVGLQGRDSINIFSVCLASRRNLLLIPFQSFSRAQLRWAGHVVHVDPERIPKALTFGELHAGKRKQGGQRKRYKDVLKASPLKSYEIDPSSFENIANKHTLWRTSCNNGLKIFETARTARLREQRRRRHAGDIGPQPSPDSQFVCGDCQRICASRIGLISHRRQKH